MSRMKPAIIIAVLAIGIVAAWVLLGRSQSEPMLSGYIEGETLYLSAPVAGTVASVAAVEGTRVETGQTLFTIDPATLSAQGERAQANVLAARTQIASAEANVRQTEAEVAGAAAEAERARTDLARLLSVKSADPAAVAGKDIDSSRAALRQANARLAAAGRTADARRAQVQAARAQAEEAQGEAREVQIRVNQLSPSAPSAAKVEDVFFQPGEWVSANQAVVSLLPDDKVKVRFFVPEEQVARYRPGRKVRFSCDGCQANLSATIRYVSSRPEFTPPIIFSRSSRDRLVFMVEAAPSRPAGLQPGLPLDIVPLGD